MQLSSNVRGKLQPHLPGHVLPPRLYPEGSSKSEEPFSSSNSIEGQPAFLLHTYRSDIFIDAITSLFPISSQVRRSLNTRLSYYKPLIPLNLFNEIRRGFLMNYTYSNFPPSYVEQVLYFFVETVNACINPGDMVLIHVSQCAFDVFLQGSSGAEFKGNLSAEKTFFELQIRASMNYPCRIFALDMGIRAGSLSFYDCPSKKNAMQPIQVPDFFIGSSKYPVEETGEKQIKIEWERFPKLFRIASMLLNICEFSAATAISQHDFKGGAAGPD